ncbi:bifunctional adenosylcobinamide kinase/adenosylcobinamide-phosphate guanylyltransferase [Litoreibacter janthinus]|uniref:Bifunctional adenosylcobalamin biosynthesis protein n=1 Tax=Litoreibacter janthinus TaxID=670154 RepID=A0A1I6GFZ8_9RHOB|nr:bifunctional adenosylcobinamide kinase/adenosylcobinamide-phosphate guanylyltransferase [Litoreibacter janthinus]SFR41122.1 adenosylcobinamide kinase /adenosylcobinamide-phosphate guanylyltransferase [Litoreibacter janthinus]
MTGLPSMTMVLGGAASGKSTFAEQAILRTAKEAQKTYIATAQAFDSEMRDKIDLHQKSRAADGWITIEEPLALGPILQQATVDHVILLDCATLWLTNQLLAEADLTEASDDLVFALARCAASVVVVTNEVGQGIVPEHAMSRRFREAQGKLNQQMARDADLVVQVIAGLPLVLKGQLPEGLS